MVMMASAVTLLVLLSGVCIDRTQAYDSINNCLYSDDMLNKMATDVVEDVIRVLAPFAKQSDKRYGRPKVLGFNTDFPLAGFDFNLRSDGGVFQGFPSLRTAGEVALVFQMNLLGGSSVELNVPITFGEFVVYYDRVVLTGGGQTYTGNLTLNVKKNRFRPHFQVRHIPASDSVGNHPNGKRQNETATCRTMIDKVETLQYTDIDFDLKMNGLPDMNLKNIFNDQAKTTYTGYIIHELFETYLTRPDGSSFGILDYCVFSPPMLSLF